MGYQPILTKEKESSIFHVRTRRGTKNSKLKYKLVEDTIRKFLVTWQKINWIGFSRHWNFWLVVFLWNNLWMREGLWWKCYDLHYKIYPDSYSEKLINLCWYCWGGGLYPSMRLAGVEFFLKYWQPSSSRGQYCSSGPDPISYYKKTWLPAKLIRIVFIIYINRRETYFVNFFRLQESWKMSK